MANFQAHLNREAKLIIDRVNRINESLYSIDYNPTHKRYIVLQAEETPDVEIREFREALRACTEEHLRARKMISTPNVSLRKSKPSLSVFRAERVYGHRQALDTKGDRRTELVCLLRFRTLARG